MNKILNFPFFVALIVVSFFTDAGLEKPERQEVLNEALSRIQRAHNIPTLSVAVVENGEFIYSGSFGETASNDNGTTSAPRLRIASITKLFTAQSVMQLAEVGIVQLDDLVSRYIEQFEGSKTTIEDLLTHGSGLKDVVRPVSVDEKRPFDDYLTQSLANNTASSLSPFYYADINYNILGKVIEIASGLNYIDYVRANIIDRLGLKETYFYQTGAEFVEPEPPFHNYGVVTGASVRSYDSSYAPSEGLISTASDMAIWATAVLIEHPVLMSRESYRDMQTPRGKTSWGDLQIALGWQVLGDNVTQLAQHAGGISGYQSLLITYPLKKRAVVVLANAGEVPRWGIAQVVNQVISEQPVVLPESSQWRYQLILIGAALIIFGLIGFFIWRRFQK